MKGFKSVALAAAVASGLTGCVSMPQKTGDLHSDLPTPQIARSLLDMAEKCWTKKGTFFHDGIVVANRVEIRGTVISAFRRGPGIPDQPDFLKITINDAPGGGSHIEVVEGDYAAGMHYDLTSDVNRWVAGDLTCGKLISK